jgi:hypothetical protein
MDDGMRPTSFAGHIAVLGVLVGTFVCGLIYSISPYEVDMVFSAAEARLNGFAADILNAGSELEASIGFALSGNDSGRGRTSDPVSPDRASAIWAAWLRQNKTRAAASMVAALICLSVYRSRRRSRRAKAARSESGIHYG